MTATLNPTVQSCWDNVSTARLIACATELAAAVDSGHVDDIPFFANLYRRLRSELAWRRSL